MVKENLADIIIPEIPAGEKILKEGVIAIKMLYYKPWLNYLYKFAITEKGMWMRCPKVPLVKQKTSFISFDDLVSYELSRYDEHPCVIFFPKEGKPLYRIFFDDHDGAVKMLDTLLPLSTNWTV